MYRMLLLRNINRIRLYLIVPVLGILYGCAPSGMIIDRDTFETPVKKMYLSEEPYLKVLHGGCIQKISLKQIQMVKISRESSMFFENELFYGGEVILKSGAKIQSSKDKTKQNPVFISIQNTLKGKSKEHAFSISLDNIVQIQVKK